MFSLCSGWVLWSRAVYEPVCSHCVGWVLWSRAVYEPVCSHCVQGGYCGLWSRAVYEPVCSHCVQGGYCGLGLCMSLCVLTVFRVGTVVSGCV